MEKYVLIHVPHSSLYIPSLYRDKCLISSDKLDEENIFMCDYLVDKLIDGGNLVVFPYSRLYCDVERFKDDSEVMNKYGMGYIYTKTSLGEDMFNPSLEYRENITKIYDSHHDRLDRMVTDILSEYNKCIIIDLHSYSDLIVKRLFDYDDNPDICLGIDEDYYSEELINYLTRAFEGCGYSVKINYPYSGSLVPNKYYGYKNTNIVSIMIEINKRIYLNDFDNFKSNLNKILKKVK